jgi:hypothetical protein
MPSNVINNSQTGVIETMRRDSIWQVRVGIVVALAALFLMPTAAVAQPTSSSGHTAGMVVPAGLFGPNQARGPTDVRTATLLGTTSISGASAAPSTSSQPGGPVATRDFSTSSPTTTPSVPTLPPGQAASLGGAGGSVSARGLNAFDSGQANVIPGFGPLDIEPPDQGLCVGNGYALETINLAVRVYTTSFAPVSGVQSLASLVGFPVSQQFGVSKVGGGYILSDPRCLFDAGTGHWFISFLYLGGKGVFSRGGPFPLGPSTYGAEIVLASTGGSPLGPFNIYLIDVSSDPLASNCPCFGDQPLLGADANTLIVSTNEFPIFANGFNGAQVYLFDKLALAAGSASVHVAHFNIGLTVNPPDNGGIGCAASGGLYCFYSVDPTVSPTTGSYDTSQSGTAWAVSSLDFFGSGDNRLAVWSFANTASIRSASPAIALSLALLSGLESYASVGQPAPQKVGPIPLGDVVYSNTGPGGGGCVAACSVGPLDSGGDGAHDTATYAQGAIWLGLSTVIATAPSTQSLGVAFWAIHAVGSSVSVQTQGYIAVVGASLLYPSVGVGPTGNALVTFTVTSPSNFPSTGFAWVSPTGSGAIGGTVFISAPGQSPQDGFTEYQDIQNSFYRPRWGDYTFAIWSGGTVYFSTEYIQFPNCSDSAFAADSTCGGTRDTFANWGTSLNSVAVS